MSKADSMEQKKVVREAMVKLLELQICSGVPAKVLARLVHECLDEARQSTRLRPRNDELFDAQDYGTVLKTWHKEAKYLSADGFPRPLPTTGLRRLIQRYYPKTPVLPILKSLRDARLIKKCRNGKWLPTEKCAVFPRLNDALLAHLSEGVSRLV